MPSRAPAEPDHLTPEGALLDRTRRLAPDRRARRAGAAPTPWAERAAWLPPAWRAATHPGTSLAGVGSCFRRPEFWGLRPPEPTPLQRFCLSYVFRNLCLRTTFASHMCFVTCAFAQPLLLICASQLVPSLNLRLLYVLGTSMGPLISLCPYLGYNV